MKAIIIVERDGWTWRIEEQADCEDGVDIVWQEDRPDQPSERTCIGSHEDAVALAKAILAYVEFARK